MEKHPPMNPLTVLEKVFSQLSIEDLKSCRLVSKTWSQESTIILRKSVVSLIPIGTPAALRGLISLSKSSPIVPFTKFNFSSHFFSLPNCGPTFTEFLSIFQSDLESLSITLDRESDRLAKLGENSLKFPKLVNLSFTGHGLDASSCSGQEGIPEIFKSLVSSSPRVESLSIIMDGESKGTVQQLIGFMTQNGHLKSIQSLEIYASVGDQEILALSKIPFQLKVLKCDFHSSCFLQESFKAFLSSQRDSLEYLKFDNYYGNSCYTVAFPSSGMRKVKTLKIDGHTEHSNKDVQFLPFSYSHQFPSLNKLVLGGSIEFNQCWGVLFPEDDAPATSVKELKLTARYIDPTWVKRAGMMFPQLEKLSLAFTPQTEALAQVVFKTFTKIVNLRELTIYFHPETGSVDHLLTGMPEEVCHRLEKNLGESGTLALGKMNRDVGLCDLRSLETLRFKADKTSSDHISDVTVHHCLLPMENLKHLFMPSFKISQSALAKLSAKLNLHLT